MKCKCGHKIEKHSKQLPERKYPCRNKDCDCDDFCTKDDEVKG